MARKFALESWLLSLYLGVAPVYWLPDVSPVAVDAAKTALVVIAVGMAFIRISVVARVYLPSNLLGPIGFAFLLLFSIPGLVQARGTSLAVAFIVDIGFSAIFLWCFYNLARGSGDVRRIFNRGIVIIAFFAALTVASVLIDLPDWRAPLEWQPAYSSQPLAATGFGGGRTGWSNALALYLPVALLLYTAKSSQKSALSRVFCIVVIAGLLGSQLASGGRAGLLASLFTVAAFVRVRSSRQMGVFVVVGVLLVAAVVPLEVWFTHLRLHRLSSLPLSRVELDAFSTYRIEGYILAVEGIKERPFIGYGIGQILVFNLAGKASEIHNLWLKWAIYSGILAPLLFLAMVCVALRKAWRLTTGRTMENTTDRNVAVALGLILLSGLTVSLFEPNALIGAFHNTAIWWAAAGSLLGIYSRRKAMGE